LPNMPIVLMSFIVGFSALSGILMNKTMLDDHLKMLIRPRRAVKHNFRPRGCLI
jgi:hypothetical protein